MEDAGAITAGGIGILKLSTHMIAGTAMLWVIDGVDAQAFVVFVTPLSGLGTLSRAGAIKTYLTVSAHLVTTATMVGIGRNLDTGILALAKTASQTSGLLINPLDGNLYATPLAIDVFIGLALWGSNTIAVGIDQFIRLA